MIYHCTSTIILSSPIHYQSCSANDFVRFDLVQDFEVVNVEIPVQPDTQRRLDEDVRVLLQFVGP